MRSALGHRRSTGGGGGTSFLSLTSWARPSFTPTRTVTFNSLTTLQNALSGMQAGDLIKIAPGTGQLLISGSGVELLSITNYNPTSNVVIDFGTSKSIWNSGAVSTDYTKFNQTTSKAGYQCVFMQNCSNLTIYGGEFTSGFGAIQVYGGVNNVTWWDWWAHDMGGGGGGFNPSGGNITNCSFRGEVGPNWAMNPTTDDHADKGTGIHCFLLENTGSTQGNINSNTVAIYGHDSLQMGASSYGQTWPEGGGGSCVEIGNGFGSAHQLNNNTLYVKAENFYMQPGNGTNPGSTTVQTGGNAANIYGSCPLNGLVYGWLEGTNLSGAVVHCTNTGWTSASPPVTVNHGRHTNVLIGYPHGQAQNNPYYTGFNVVYNDCT